MLGGDFSGAHLVGYLFLICIAEVCVFHDFQLYLL